MEHQSRNEAVGGLAESTGVNSYKRLVPGYEAPCYVAWSASNRSALIRIPSARGSATRVELTVALIPPATPIWRWQCAWLRVWTA